jgi:ABC-type molybdate transport system ATPase subunit
MCNDTLLFDSAGGLDRPPHRRHIGYVFQDGRLFPHLTVAQNLDYGRRMYRLPRDEGAHARVVAMLDIGHLLARRKQSGRPRLGCQRQKCVAEPHPSEPNPRRTIADRTVTSLTMAFLAADPRMA